jgi:hypothetical protein
MQGFEKGKDFVMLLHSVAETSINWKNLSTTITTVATFILHGRDGGASSGGSPCGHSSREPEEKFKSQTVGGDVKEQEKKLVAENASTMNLISPLYHSSIFQFHDFPRRYDMTPLKDLTAVALVF